MDIPRTWPKRPVSREHSGTNVLSRRLQRPRPGSSGVLPRPRSVGTADARPRSTPVQVFLTDDRSRAEVSSRPTFRGAPKRGPNRPTSSVRLGAPAVRAAAHAERPRSTPAGIRRPRSRESGSSPRQSDAVSWGAFVLSGASVSGFESLFDGPGMKAMRPESADQLGFGRRPARPDSASDTFAATWSAADDVEEYLEYLEQKASTLAPSTDLVPRIHAVPPLELAPLEEGLREASAPVSATSEGLGSLKFGSARWSIGSEDLMEFQVVTSSEAPTETPPKETEPHIESDSEEEPPPDPPFVLPPSKLRPIIAPAPEADSSPQGDGGTATGGAIQLCDDFTPPLPLHPFGAGRAQPKSYRMHKTPVPALVESIDYNAIDPMDDGSVKEYLREYKRMRKAEGSAQRIQTWWRVARPRDQQERSSKALLLMRRQIIKYSWVRWMQHVSAQRQQRRWTMSHAFDGWFRYARDAAYHRAVGAGIYLEAVRRRTVRLPTMAMFNIVRDAEFFAALADPPEVAGVSQRMTLRMQTMAVVVVMTKLRFWAHRVLWRWSRYVVFKELQRQRAKEHLHNALHDYYFRKENLSFQMWRRWSRMKAEETRGVPYTSWADHPLKMPEWDRLIERKEKSRTQPSGMADSLRNKVKMRVWRTWAHSMRNSRRLLTKILVRHQAAAIREWSSFIRAMRVARWRKMRTLHAWIRLYKRKERNRMILREAKAQLTTQLLSHVWHAFVAHRYDRLAERGAAWLDAAAEQMDVPLPTVFWAVYAWADRRTHFIFVNVWRCMCKSAYRRTLWRRCIVYLSEQWERKMLAGTFQVWLHVTRNAKAGRTDEKVEREEVYDLVDFIRWIRTSKSGLDAEKLKQQPKRVLPVLSSTQDEEVLLPAKEHLEMVSKNNQDLQKAHESLGSQLWLVTLYSLLAKSEDDRQDSVKKDQARKQGGLGAIEEDGDESDQSAQSAALQRQKSFKAGLGSISNKPTQRKKSFFEEAAKEKEMREREEQWTADAPKKERARFGVLQRDHFLLMRLHLERRSRALLKAAHKYGDDEANHKENAEALKRAMLRMPPGNKLLMCELHDGGGLTLFGENRPDVWSLEGSSIHPGWYLNQSPRWKILDILGEEQVPPASPRTPVQTSEEEVPAEAEMVEEDQISTKDDDAAQMPPATPAPIESSSDGESEVQDEGTHELHWDEILAVERDDFDPRTAEFEEVRKRAGRKMVAELRDGEEDLHVKLELYRAGRRHPAPHFFRGMNPEYEALERKRQAELAEKRRLEEARRRQAEYEKWLEEEEIRKSKEAAAQRALEKHRRKVSTSGIKMDIAAIHRSRHKSVVKTAETAEPKSVLPQQQQSTKLGGQLRSLAAFAIRHGHTAIKRSVLTPAAQSTVDDAVEAVATASDEEPVEKDGVTASKEALARLDLSSLNDADVSEVDEQPPISPPDGALGGGMRAAFGVAKLRRKVHAKNTGTTDDVKPQVSSPPPSPTGLSPLPSPTGQADDDVDVDVHSPTAVVELEARLRRASRIASVVARLHDGEGPTPASPEAAPHFEMMRTSQLDIEADKTNLRQSSKWSSASPSRVVQLPRPELEYSELNSQSEHYDPFQVLVRNPFEETSTPLTGSPTHGSAIPPPSAAQMLPQVGAVTPLQTPNKGVVAMPTLKLNVDALPINPAEAAAQEFISAGRMVGTGGKHAVFILEAPAKPIDEDAPPPPSQVDARLSVANDEPIEETQQQLTRPKGMLQAEQRPPTALSRVSLPMAPVAGERDATPIVTTVAGQIVAEPSVASSVTPLADDPNYSVWKLDVPLPDVVLPKPKPNRIYTRTRVPKAVATSSKGLVSEQSRSKAGSRKPSPVAGDAAKPEIGSFACDLSEHTRDNAAKYLLRLDKNLQPARSGGLHSSIAIKPKPMDKRIKKTVQMPQPPHASVQPEVESAQDVPLLYRVPGLSVDEVQTMSSNLNKAALESLMQWHSETKLVQEATESMQAALAAEVLVEKAQPLAVARTRQAVQPSDLAPLALNESPDDSGVDSPAEIADDSIPEETSLDYASSAAPQST